MVLVRGGRIITEVDDYVADILVDEGRIVAIGRKIEPPAGTEVVEAAERLVLPGCVDPHTHMDMPFGPTFTCDDFTSGTVAAAFGGTTCHVDFCMQQPGQSIPEALDAWFEKLRVAPPVVDVGFHVAVTDLSSPARIDELRELPGRGITSFKVFMAYKGSFMVDDAGLLQTMEVAAESGSLVMTHCENGDVVDLLVRRAVAAGDVSPRHHLLTRPPLVEVEATARAVRLAELAGAPLYVVHVSCGEAAAEIAAAQRRGQAVWGETCTHYLVVDDSVFATDDFAAARYVFSPPARDRSEHDRLWDAIRAGTLSVIASDHAPFSFEQRELGRGDFSKIPNGAAGVEERLLVVHELGVRGGRISLNEMVGLLSTRPAKLFGLYPRKGTIAVGADADLVIFDPELRLSIGPESMRTRCDTSVFDGMQVTGAPETVLVRGIPVVRNRELVAEPGTGRFVKRGAPMLGATPARVAAEVAR
ncbi:dihydropyrimidinase [Conexibacter sp. CPCC 206217]|uniref:dihydropyrimidinase n=1 Tax=Conexibacter sp. CPCC 206217 TaxID=3064574 RepID=UPI0027266127|nr:dihydropyrimidinase [Conexibacter sp. CPCC 206217]MDO8210192.1 dihydropyrimidinase [Conexibacter sp. CPCC 206217]